MAQRRTKQMTVWQFLGHAFRLAFARPKLGMLLVAGLTGQVFYYLAIPLTYRYIFLITYELQPA